MQLKKDRVNGGGPAVGWRWEVIFFSANCKYFQTQPAGKNVHRKTTFSFNIMNENYFCVLHQTILESWTKCSSDSCGSPQYCLNCLSVCTHTSQLCHAQACIPPQFWMIWLVYGATIHHSSPVPLFISGNHHEIIQLHNHSSLCPPLIWGYPWWSVFTSLTSTGSLGLFWRWAPSVINGVCCNFCPKTLALYVTSPMCHLSITISNRS